MTTTLHQLIPNLQGQEVDFSDKDLVLKTPFKLSISGQSGSGKTHLCQRILSEKLYDVPASQIILCLPKNSNHLLQETIQDYRSACEEILVHEGVPNAETLNLTSNSSHKILIFDDLMAAINNDPKMCELMIFSARKANLSIITISQNMFQNSKFGVTIRRQQNYHIIFNSFGDLALISNLNRIFYQSRGNILHQSFSTLANIEPNPYKQYILLDCHPKSPFPRSMKLRSNIFDFSEPYFFMTDE